MSRIYDDCFIVMSQYGIQRMTKRPGKLNRGEVSVRIRVTLPEAVFEEPNFTASIDVPESAVIKRDADVQIILPEDQPDAD